MRIYHCSIKSTAVLLIMFMCSQTYILNCIAYFTQHYCIILLFIEPPKFLVTPSGTKTINIGGANGAAATCLICVNCTVRGAPAPTVTWQYQSGNMFGFNSVITNQSNASSPYYQLDNGQVSISAILTLF